MEYAVLGDPEDGPQLRLDHREFSYAGKFVMSNTGKAVAREDRCGVDREGKNDDIVGAIAFNEDRTDPRTAWLRYVTVRENRRGEGVGARLARFAAARLRARGYDRIKIAVNNPFAYQALYKAGFAYADEETGLAELVLVRTGKGDDERDTDRYRSGLDVYRERDDLAPAERSFLAAKADAEPPDVLDVPE
jgi:GNAT superfamily N-acetyltransferase